MSWLTERLGIHRVKAALVTGVPVWLLGLAVCLSFNRWSDVTIFGRDLFKALEGLTTQLMMPLSGMAIAIYVGWMMGRAVVSDEIRLTPRRFALWFNVLRYVVPIGIVMVFFHVLGLLKWQG